VCIQVNVSGEASKSGVAPGELPALAHAVAACRGCAARPDGDPRADLRRGAAGALCRAARARPAQRRRPGLDTLSMGMSDDLEAAIAEGSTMVRVGTAIFGRAPDSSPGIQFLTERRQ
jgi:uncharacterized pyridoxal phosphate-containing UPF0001 family protein